MYRRSQSLERLVVSNGMENTWTLDSRLRYTFVLSKLKNALKFDGANLRTCTLRPRKKDSKQYLSFSAFTLV